ncbi:hypothetical protein [Bifidobacterium sp. 7101]|uniref:hypothetical protein n=1 Tax=Bifidobacterium sp. 7101 TaxID=1394175 RepID=UPI0004A32F2F|nr:hypothetical protein [Bifidobacterium sp. 7101]
MTTNTVNLKMSGKITYDDSISVDQAANIILLLNSEENEDNAETKMPVAIDSYRTSAYKNSGRLVTSARDALNRSNAKTNPEKIVALGKYIMQDGGNSFTAQEIKSQFHRAREIAPKNFSRDLNCAIREGWIDEATPGNYYITNKINGIFDGNFKFPKAGSHVSRTRSANKATKEKPEVFSEIDEFSPQIEGIPDYAKMKTEADRVLWALYFAKNNNINGLKTSAIAWLTNELGNAVDSKNISRAARSHRAGNRINHSTNDKTLRITESGEAFLKEMTVEKV